MSRYRPMKLERDERTAPERADAEDLRSVIVTALAAVPVDEDALRHRVWTLVGNERNAGASPGQVIIALTDLVSEARLAPASVHQTRLRQMILWCVEAYFGHLGGDVLDREANEFLDLPRPASNR